MSGHIFRGHPISATEYKGVLPETKTIKTEPAIYLLPSFSNFKTSRPPAFLGDALIDLACEVLLREVCGEDLLPHL